MRRSLRIAAAVELLSLVILLVNLATAHLRPITSLCGPIHGCAYLFVIILTASHPVADRTAKLLAWLPGLGGVLVARRVSTVRTG